MFRDKCMNVLVTKSIALHVKLHTHFDLVHCAPAATVYNTSTVTYAGCLKIAEKEKHAQEKQFTCGKQFTCSKLLCSCFF